MEDKLKFITGNMKSLRVRAGYSQEQVAELLNVSRNTYMNYELNPSRLSINIYYKLADIFNCNVNDFFVEFNVAKSNS